MTTESPQAAPLGQRADAATRKDAEPEASASGCKTPQSASPPETPRANPAVGAAAGLRDEAATQFAQTVCYPLRPDTAFAKKCFRAGWDARADEIARLRAEVETEKRLRKAAEDECARTVEHLNELTSEAEKRAEQAEAQLAKVALALTTIERLAGEAEDDADLKQISKLAREAMSEERSGR